MKHKKIGFERDYRVYIDFNPWETLNTDSAAGLPTETDEQKTQEYIKDKGQRLRSEEQFAPELRHLLRLRINYKSSRLVVKIILNTCK